MREIFKIGEMLDRTRECVCVRERYCVSERERERVLIQIVRYRDRSRVCHRKMYNSEMLGRTRERKRLGM